MAVKLFHKLYTNSESNDHLIILHGLFGMLDNWHNMANELSKHINVITVDQRNHGHSPHTSDMSFELMSDDLALLMDDLSIEKAILMGHSMGGKTVMRFADIYPHRVEKLIVVDIAPKVYKPGHNTYFKAFESIDFSKISRRKDADDEFKKFEDNIGIRQFLLKNLDKDNEGYRLKINVKVIHEFYPKMIDRMDFNWVINIPTLFVSGSLSNYINETDKEDILNVFPLADFEVVEGAGHWVHAEQPKKFLTTILDFIV